MRYYIVDAFTDKRFHGNPAGVCLPDDVLSDAQMQSIAAENNLPETAFAVARDGAYELRWFTPETEMDLCGHATLATGFVLSTLVDPLLTHMVFQTKSGVLTVEKNGDLFEMNLPARMPVPIPVTPQMEEAVGCTVLEAHQSRDLLLLVDSEERVQNLTPDFDAIAAQSDSFAVIVTAKGEQVDFVSRFFAPNAGIPEDPVTGSAHATLVPFWSARLNREKMIARQLSKRGGTLYCRHLGERILLAGNAALYLAGEMWVE